MSLFCSLASGYSLIFSLLLLVSQTHPQLLEPSHEKLQEGCEEEEKEFDSEVRVVTVQFEELQIELMVVCFILLVVLAKTGEWGGAVCTYVEYVALIDFN